MENVQRSEIPGYTDREVYFSSFLIDEIENENIDEVKWLLLNKNANPNLLLPNKGFSPMHVLAGFENECFSVQVIEIAIVERGGDPNVRSADGLTPVHLAAIWGRCAALEIFLKFGGDPFLLEHKFSLNAEDLALKEHQWQTHAILATFSVFNDRPKYEELDDWLQSNVECTSKITLSLKNEELNKNRPSTCGGLISKNLNSQDNSNVRLSEIECQTKEMHQTARSISKCSHEDGLPVDGNKHLVEENTKEQDNKIQRKKKLSDQFAESFTKFRHFFGRASFPRLSSGNSPNVDSKRRSSKVSI